jgi:hypothetical protein
MAERDIYTAALRLTSRGFVNRKGREDGERPENSSGFCVRGDLCG